MLTQLCIQNFTVIAELELEFKSKMTVLTGETGAGKSILIDALLLTLGGRADSTVIQTGKDRCTISANFDIAKLPAAQQWLAEHELAHDDECILRRVITADGRSRGYINEQAVSIQALREIGNLLISIHGQHEHQTLLKAEKQRLLLDLYAGHSALVKKVQETYTTWKKTQAEFDALKIQTEQRSARQELLAYQVQELDALALQENELNELDRDQRQLASAGNTLENCQNTLALLEETEDANILQLLNNAQQLLKPLKNRDTKLDNVLNLLDNAEIQLQEASSELRNYLDHIELNPERLQFVEQRLSAIHEMARKHHTTPDKLLELQQHLHNELALLENSDSQLKKLAQEINELAQAYQQAATELSQSRLKVAEKLAPQIEKSMRELGMPGGKFLVQFEPLAEPTATGLERIEFNVSTNPGQPLQALSKVVSGGELSRISLAIHVLTAKNDHKPTLIFDEVDVGIGGGTAEIVGRLLRTLSNSAQILCVTHLPQVAALSHQHFQVNKSIVKNKVLVAARELDKTAKIKEIARMLGGIKVTEQTLAHAQEMIETA